MTPSSGRTVLGIPLNVSFAVLTVIVVVPVMMWAMFIANRPSSSPQPSPTAPAGRTASLTIVVPTMPAERPTVGVWTGCDASVDRFKGGCRDMHTDSCDGSERASKDGSLLDNYIENKLFVDAERLKDCPQFLPTWERAKTGFDSGTWSVPDEVKPGTYETTAHLNGGKVTDCYWERRRGGGVADNDFVVGAVKVRVTIKSGDEAFTSRGCGNWVKV